MDINELLTAVVRYFFVFIAILTLIDLARYRDRVRLDIALMFSTFAVLFVIQIVSEQMTVPNWVNQLSSMALLMQPYLMLRLVTHFRQLSTKIQIASLVGGLFSAASIIVFPDPSPPLVSLTVVAYFVLVEAYATQAFIREALTRGGVARWRLGLVAAGAGFFALVLAVVGVIIALRLEELGDLATSFLLVMVLLSGLSYYLGFATPRFLHQVWQHAELRRFLEQLRAVPPGERLVHTQTLLFESAVRAVGGLTAVLVTFDAVQQHWQVSAAMLPIKLPSVLQLDEKLISLTFIAAQKPLHLSVTDDPGLEKFTKTIEAKTALIIPLVADQQAWGNLLVFLPHSSLFVDDDLTLLKLLTDQAVHVLSYEALLAEVNHSAVEIRRQAARAQTLVRVASHLSADLKLENVIERICSETAAALDQPMAGVMLYDAERQEFNYAGGVGVAPTFAEVLQPVPYDLVTDYLSADGELLTIISNLQELSHLPDTALFREMDIRTTLSVALMREEQLIGFLSVGTVGEEKEFTDDELETVRGLAAQAALAIVNAQLLAAMENELHERILAEQALQRAHDELEQRVQERTKELSLANKELVRSNEELDQFAYVVSHDLRAPLRALHNFSQFLSADYADKLDTYGQGYVQNILENALRMDNLVVSLLEYSRIRRIQVPFSQVNVANLLEYIIPHLGLCKETKIELPPDLPTVWAMEIRLQQIFSNLLSNAAKFHRPNQPPLISISCTNSEDFWQFSIKDNGIGIDPNHFDKIFGVFQRLHHDDDYEGTGIGLAIVKKAVTEHGGEIFVDSTPNEGSEFIFTLPQQPGGV